MADQSNIIGYEVRTECEAFDIQENKPLTFITSFIQELSDLLQQIRKPPVAVSLFRPFDGADFGIAIFPVNLNDIHVEKQERRSFGIRVELSTSDSNVISGFAKILHSARFVDSAITHLKKRHGFLNNKISLSIIDFDNATLLITFDKTI